MNRTAFADRVEWRCAHWQMFRTLAVLTGLSAILALVAGLVLDDMAPALVLAVFLGAMAAGTALVGNERSKRLLTLDAAGLTTVKAGAATRLGWHEIAAVHLRLRSAVNPMAGAAFVRATARDGRMAEAALVFVEVGVFLDLLIDLNTPLAAHGLPLTLEGPQALQDELASLRASAAPRSPIPPRPTTDPPGPR
ncbi:hypothetical protein [Yinghuangia soli]|uniref:Uncharacterized protein n=1 Tax=Yinghuangia soli TaxID=2908204 RepID=A0AA41Q5P2_9ACTN|nr:hypothetical protein [Yinghuangia soli]MCF2531455.1 hypothetical protein [Yinghuangia soli]